MEAEYQSKQESAKENAQPRQESSPITPPASNPTPEPPAVEASTPLPRAVIPPGPFPVGEGHVLSVEFGESKRRPYAVIMQAGYILYATENVKLPLGSGSVALFDLLKNNATGKDCRFSVVKQKTRGGMSHKIVGVSQIGEFRWNDVGEPVIPEEYKATNADLPAGLF